MKKFLKKNSVYFTGALAGATFGLLYWYFIGCSGGSCAITSDPVNSTLYFSAAGALVGGTFRKKPEQEPLTRAGSEKN